ncbi:hypothetical protein CAC42_3777 [Sphaceloma murrayae]|uniref:DNA-directed RNA polymerase III subunit RPC3 n=1 Tax=Sphaceloma murrayae TaxID=2082308 RepID=A0A2K1QHU5_9PEZI|nr:hypothetical protein CAC42_3777 [Sphaceloma murrayae]
MAKNLNELCLLLVEDFYGDLSAHVFKTLASWGRVTLRTLVAEADIPAKHVFHGLTVLIQQHLVFHHTPTDSPTFYEVDWDGAYNLLRSGKIVTAVEARLGPKPAQALASLLQLGHARVSDMEEAFKYDKVAVVPRTATNGVHAGASAPTDIAAGIDADQHIPVEDKIVDRADLHLALYQLLKAGYISKVHNRTYVSAADRQNELEEFVRQTEFSQGKTTGPKARIRFQNAIIARKRAWQETDNNLEDVVDRNAKRIKLNGDLPNGNVKHEHRRDAVTLNAGLVLRVNFDKCLVAMRSDRLVQYSQRYLGEATSRVYEALLHVVEADISTTKQREEMVYDEKEGDSTEEPEIFSAAPGAVLDYLQSMPGGLDGLDLSLGGPRANSSHDHKPNSKRKYDECDQTSSIKRRADVVAQVTAHLRLLAEHQHSFVARTADRDSAGYHVPFQILRESLRNAEIESIIAFRFGSVASRIVRILKSRGKLDEKQISNFALLKIKDIRALLDEMQVAGFVETQEIPKDNTRQPGRSLYLWYFDQQRVEQLVLQRSYKAMSRCLQRVKVQRDIVRGSIEKAERTDVVGNEDKYLTPADKMHLRTWREQEEKLLCQVARMDEGIAAIRDY